MKSGFRDDPERIGLNLARCRRVLAWGLRATLGVQAVGRCPERLANDGTDLGGEPAVDDEHAVLVLIDRERPAAVLLLGLTVLGVAIDAPPGAGHLLDVG